VRSTNRAASQNDDLEAGACTNLRSGRASPPKQETRFSLKDHLCRITGVDLTKVAGLQVQTVQTIISEVGVDMSRWGTENSLPHGWGCVQTTGLAGAKFLRVELGKL
jgi:transposase